MLKAARSAWPWAALPCAAVLAFDPNGFAPFGPAKWALVPALVFAGTAVGEERRRSPRTWREWALPAFVAWTAVSAAFGLDRVYVWTGTPERHFGVIAWVLVLLCWWGGRSLDGAGRRLVLASTGVTTAMLGAWAGAEALGWRPLSLVGIGDRPVGPLGSSAFLGAAAVLLTPIAVNWMVDAPRSRRIGAALASAFGLIALAASGARAAWFGAAVVAIVVVVLRRRQRAVVLVVTGCVVVVVAVAVATGVAGRASSVATDRDGGARGRLDEWRVASRVVAAHPVLGTGPEGYRIAFGQEVDDRYERDHGRNPLPDRAHSALLDVAATTGLVGVLLYVLAVGAAVLAALKALRDGPPELAGAAVGVLAYFAQSLFLFPIAELEPVAWLLAGICATGCASRRIPAPDTPSSARRGVTTVAAALAGALAVVALAAGVLDVVADRRAKRALEALASDRPASATVATLRPDQVRYHLIDARAHAANGSSRGLARAIADLDRALEISPRDPVARREKGRLLLSRARRSNASAAAVAAARSYLEELAVDDPRSAEVWLRLGIARELVDDTSGAISAWRRAEHLAPRSVSATSNLAVALARLGRNDEALAAARRALRLDPTNAAARTVLDSIANSDGT